MHHREYIVKKIFLFLAALALLLSTPAALSENKISYFGFYGGVDSNNRVINPATIMVDGEPVGFYTTANPRAYFYVEFETIQSPYELTLKWVDPDGKETLSTIKRTQPGVLSNVWFWWSLVLSENSTPGVWEVVLYNNNEPLLQSNFILQTPQNIVDRLSQLVDENDRLSSELEKSTAEIERLGDELSKASAQAERLQSEKTQLQNDLASARESLNKASTELDQVKTNNKQLTEQLNAVKNLVSSLEQQRMLLIALTIVVAVAAVAVTSIISRRRKQLPPPPSA